MALSRSVHALIDPARPETRIAIVGASNDRRKYGHIILQDLRAKGFTVVPVNPSEPTIAGIAAYPSVTAIPDKVDIVNFVVPPEVALEVLESLDPARTPVVWFQPGAFDRAVIDAAKARFPEVVAGDCIMVVTR